MTSSSNLPSPLTPLVLCGPSGCGKSTLMKKLMEEFVGKFGFSVSHTTRNPRPGEVNGRHYHFVSQRSMEHSRKSGAFIEHAEFSGNFYGTSKKAVEDVLNSGKICILDIDVQGVKAVKTSTLNPRYVFIKPPSLKILEERLRSRGTENEAAIQKRLSIAESEIEYGETDGNFDLVLVNDDLERAYQELRAFIFPDLVQR